MRLWNPSGTQGTPEFLHEVMKWKCLGGSFQKLRVPPNHPFVQRVFHYKPSILRGFPPIFGSTPISNYKGSGPPLYFWKHPGINHLQFGIYGVAANFQGHKSMAVEEPSAQRISWCSPNFLLIFTWIFEFGGLVLDSLWILIWFIFHFDLFMSNWLR